MQFLWNSGNPYAIREPWKRQRYPFSELREDGECFVIDKKYAHNVRRQYLKSGFKSEFEVIIRSSFGRWYVIRVPKPVKKVKAPRPPGRPKAPPRPPIPGPGSGNHLPKVYDFATLRNVGDGFNLGKILRDWASFQRQWLRSAERAAGMQLVRRRIGEDWWCVRTA